MHRLLTILCLLRPLVASRRFGLIGAPMTACYWLRYTLSRRRYGYRQARRRYASAGDLTAVCEYFRSRFGYRPDHLGGLAEHDSSIYEAVVRAGEYDIAGDCDDCARLAALALARLGYRTQLVSMVRGRDLRSLHAECLFYVDEFKMWYAFNYGAPVGGLTPASAVLALCHAWYCKEHPESVTFVRYRAL